MIALSSVEILFLRHDPVLLEISGLGNYGQGSD